MLKKAAWLLVAIARLVALPLYYIAVIYYGWLSIVEIVQKAGCNCE